MTHPRRKPRPAAAPPAPPPADAEAVAAEKAFVEALIASGQAAKVDEHGQLPAGATHEIVKTADGETQVVRRRFSMY